MLHEQTMGRVKVKAAVGTWGGMASIQGAPPHLRAGEWISAPWVTLQ